MGITSNHSHIMFGDLKSAAGVKALNTYLEENSYIEGFVPSQADTSVFEALGKAPASEFAHALRWYNHIKSFGAGMKQFAKATKEYVGGAAPAAAAEEEDDEEKKRITEERLKAYHEKKSKKPAVIAKT